MPRFTLDRAAVHAEVERRKAATPAKAVPISPAVTPPKPARWSARVFVVPAAVAQALSKLATRTLFGTVGGPPSGEPHSMRRHRGVYIWRPTRDQQGRPDAYGELVTMDDERTAESEITKLSRDDLH